jgi:single-stranded DNA-binding protein
MQIFISGRLKSKPEVRETRNAKTLVKLLIEEDSDERDRQPSILPVTFFAHAANRAKELQPGDAITVVCHLNGTRFETESGEVRYGVQLIGEKILVEATSKKEVATR